MTTRPKHPIIGAVIATVRGLAITSASVLFLPGYLVASALPILYGRLWGATIRTWQRSSPTIRTPYRAGGRSVSWIQLIRACVITQLLLGAVLLAPLCIRASGDLGYLLPLTVRQSRLLLNSSNHLPLIGRFVSRFPGTDFYRYWAGISCWVASMPDVTVRRLMRIEAHGSKSASSRASLALLDGIAALDDRLAALGFNAYLTSGVLVAIFLLAIETTLFSFVAH